MDILHPKVPGCWINDPNGFIYCTGKYHLFYQCFPNKGCGTAEGARFLPENCPVRRPLPPVRPCGDRSIDVKSQQIKAANAGCLPVIESICSDINRAMILRKVFVSPAQRICIKMKRAIEKGE